MTGVALAGVVVAAMATVYVTMRDNYARDQAAREAENLRQYIQGVVNQPGLCSKAMLVGGALPYWDYAIPNSRSQDINQFQVVLPTGGPGTIITLPGQYGSSLWITRMYLREPIATAAFREGIPYQTPSTLDMGAGPPIPVQIVAAKLVIELQVGTMNPLTNTKFLKNKTADVTVAIDQATKQVLLCSSALRSSPSSYSCNATTVNPAFACPPNKWCQFWYYIQGFDVAGVADCRCATSCVGTNPMGPGVAAAAPGAYGAVVGGIYGAGVGGIMAVGGVVGAGP